MVTAPEPPRQTGPLAFTDDDGRRFRALAGRNYVPVGTYSWIPPDDFYERDGAR